jgi:hypothetical protein
MRRSVVRLMVPTIMVLGLMLLPATPAAAIQPQIVRIRDIHIVQVDDTSCDFPFLEEADGFIDRITFFEESGTPTRVIVHAFFQGTLTNEATGESVRGVQELNVTFDLEEGTTTWTGIRFLVAFPQLGAVFLDVGRVVFDRATGEVLFEAGPHQLVHEDFDEFCDALRS